MLTLYDLKSVPRTWRTAFIPKKSGGKRKLQIPNDDLKNLQHDILQYLYTLVDSCKLKVSSVAHGFVPFKNTMTSLLQHDRESEVFICADIKDFFDNVNPAFTEAKFLDGGVEKERTKELIGACTNEGHFPQGGPASPYLTNITMFDADCQIAAYAKKHGFKYTRYADDMTFSIRETTPEILKSLRREENNRNSNNPYMWFLHGVDTILKMTMGLRLNHKKDHVIFRGSKCKPHILGICIRQDGKGYNAIRKFRNNTRAGICNLYHKVIVNQHGKIEYDDWHMWASLCGRIRYMRDCRLPSDEDCNGFDPAIQLKYYQPLKELFDEQRSQLSS